MRRPKKVTPRAERRNSVYLKSELAHPRDVIEGIENRVSGRRALSSRAKDFSHAYTIDIGLQVDRREIIHALRVVGVDSLPARRPILNLLMKVVRIDAIVLYNHAFQRPLSAAYIQKMERNRRVMIMEVDRLLGGRFKEFWRTLHELEDEKQVRLSKDKEAFKKRKGKMPWQE